jgi:hypothetical protein
MRFAFIVAASTWMILMASEADRPFDGVSSGCTIGRSTAARLAVEVKPLGAGACAAEIWPLEFEGAFLKAGDELRWPADPLVDGGAEMPEVIPFADDEFAADSGAGCGGSVGPLGGGAASELSALS